MVTAATKPHHHGPEASTVTLTLTPQFKLVLLTVVGITVLSILIACPLALFQIRSGMELKPGSLGSVLFDTCIATFKLGFGAILGLLGGKAL
jgi:hypothetical protein